ncbi:MAG: hypothetical protein EHM58_13370 [Ignavibacteriae bacterium]|nr:MAG: hypothetical protein EHM58_13370 [Ignavibacteriota bacterium]
MALEKYKQKRDFKKTPEPEPKKKSSRGQLKYVIQKHAASRLHYDFRLELDGVLKSWAVPKGPSLNPADKRLAMMTEDHPLDYQNFEGKIPKGEYGGGEVIIWDKGTYHSPLTTNRKRSEEVLAEDLEKGNLIFVLDGKKLKGEFALVKLRSSKINTGKQDNAWLLIKKKDEYASKEDITRQERSVVSGKSLDEIKSDEDAAVYGEKEKLSKKK